MTMAPYVRLNNSAFCVKRNGRGGEVGKEEEGRERHIDTDKTTSHKRTILLILAQAWSPARVAAERLLADDIWLCAVDKMMAA